MPSLNLDPDFLDHPKTVRLGCLVGRGTAVELVLRLWVYTSKFHRKDGTLAGYTAEILETALSWRGKPGSAVAGLLDCGKHLGKSGFLEEIDGGYQVHDWQEHQGHLEIYHDRAVAANEKRWQKVRGVRGKPDPPPSGIPQGSDKDPSRINEGSFTSPPTPQGSSRQCSTEIETPPVGGAERRAKTRPATERRPGSLDVVRAFWETGHLAGDPEAFWDHFESNGWKVGGKTPMEDWNAAARNWARNETKFNRGRAGPATPPNANPTTDEEREAVLSRLPESKTLLVDFGPQKGAM